MHQQTNAIERLMWGATPGWCRACSVVGMLAVTVAVVLACSGQPAAAQKTTTGTSSHRHIPYGERPRRDTFRTSEYEQAKDAYQAMQQLARSMAEQGIDPFQPGSTLDGRIPRRSRTPWNGPGAADGRPGTVPGSPNQPEATRPGASQPDFSNGLSEDSIAEFSKNLGKGLVEWNQALRGGATDTSAGTNSSLGDLQQRLLEARDAYYEQRRMVSRSYQRALRDYREKWPEANIPPQELFDTLQPFINEEVLEQLIKVRDYREGKLAAPPKIPDHLLPPKPQSSLSERVFESVARSIDKGGVELLKQAQQRNQGKQAVSWWKRLRKETTSSVRSVNQSITENTESYATAASSGSQQVASGGGTENASGSAIGGLIAVVLAALAIIAGWFAWCRYTAEVTAAELAVAMEPSEIQDRSSVLQAVHRVAAQHLGTKSRYWHHRKLFASLRETLREDFSPIAELYERLRYAPQGHHVSQDELTVVRRWYRKWLDADTLRPQGVPLASQPTRLAAGKQSV